MYQNCTRCIFQNKPPVLIWQPICILTNEVILPQYRERAFKDQIFKNMLFLAPHMSRDMPIEYTQNNFTAILLLLAILTVGDSSF